MLAVSGLPSLRVALANNVAIAPSYTAATMLPAAAGSIVNAARMWLRALVTGHAREAVTMASIVCHPFHCRAISAASDTPGQAVAVRHASRAPSNVDLSSNPRRASLPAHK
jgi:hypothetical protein